MSRDWLAIAARLVDESPCSLAQARRWVARTRGDRVSTLTLERWILHGKHGVLLDGMRGAGKSWLTSRDALVRFYAELSRLAAEPTAPVPVPPSRAATEKRAADAMREIERLRKMPARSSM